MINTDTGINFKIKNSGIRSLVIGFLCLLQSVAIVQGQEISLQDSMPKFNVTVNNEADDGYIFMTTRRTANKAPAGLLIADNYGTPVFYQYLPDASGGFIRQRNGLLSYRTKSASADKMFFILDSSYVLVDSVGMDTYELDTHDLIALENGNYIIFGIDARITDLTAYGGISDATVEGCVIQELDPDKNVIFEWNSWDHFDISDTYKDLTVSSVDMVHPNSLDIDYDGNILLIGRAMNEVTKINRVTGDVMWRLGGKNNQFTFGDSAQMFSMPHDFRLLENGNYTIFDNGNERDPSYSRAIEYKLDDVNMTIDLVWEYDANKEIFGPSGGSARRLPSGNTILGYGGKASWPASVEVHPDGSKALQIDFVEKMSSGRTTKSPWRTTLFEPNTYHINFGEWDGYTSYEYLLTMKNNADHVVSLTGYSTRTSAFTIDDQFPVDIPANGEVILTVVYEPLSIEHAYINDVLTIDSDIESDTLIRRVSQQIKLEGSRTDIIAPYASIAEDGAQDLPLDTFLTIVLSEPIRMLDEELFTYSTIDQLITFKKKDSEGVDISFDAVLNSDKTLITIVPDQPLENMQTFYLAISDQYEDFAGIQGTATSGTFNTGININVELPRTSLLHIYPNPGNGSYHIRFHEPGDYQVEVFDMSGKLLKKENERSVADYELDIRSYSDGQYLLKITNRETGLIRAATLIKR